MTTSPLLSVLDLVPLASGLGSAQAVRDTVALAQHAEALGYARYWVAEHHNMPSTTTCSRWSAAPPSCSSRR